MIEDKDTIIATERAALDRWGKGDPSCFLEICAPDVVYFDKRWSAGWTVSGP